RRRRRRRVAGACGEQQTWQHDQRQSHRGSLQWHGSAPVRCDAEDSPMILLERLADCLGSLAGLERQPCTLTSEWCVQRTRVYSDAATGKAGVGPYVDKERVWWLADLTVPRGTVAWTLLADADTLRWHRTDKKWSER